MQDEAFDVFDDANSDNDDRTYVEDDPFDGDDDEELEEFSPEVDLGLDPIEEEAYDWLTDPNWGRHETPTFRQVTKKLKAATRQARDLKAENEALKANEHKASAADAETISLALTAIGVRPKTASHPRFAQLFVEYCAENNLSADAIALRQFAAYYELLD